MTISEKDIPTRDLVAQYNEDDSSGRVSAMSGPNTSESSSMTKNSSRPSSTQ